MKKLLIAALVALVAGGAWNYHRNAKRVAEDEEPRPFKGLSLQELDALFAANQEERDRYKAVLQGLEKQGSPVSEYAPSDLQGKLTGFDRASRVAARWDAVRSAMLDREVEMDQIQKERRKRGAGEETSLGLVWRRITTF